VIEGHCLGLNQKPIDFIKVSYANREFSGNNSDITISHPQKFAIRGINGTFYQTWTLELKNYFTSIYSKVNWGSSILQIFNLEPEPYIRYFNAE
jgi:hypothetical protein